MRSLPPQRSYTPGHSGSLIAPSAVLRKHSTHTPQTNSTGQPPVHATPRVASGRRHSRVASRGDPPEGAQPLAALGGAAPRPRTGTARPPCPSNGPAVRAPLGSPQYMQRHSLHPAAPLCGLPRVSSALPARPPPPSSPGRPPARPPPAPPRTALPPTTDVGIGARGCVPLRWVKSSGVSGSVLGCGSGLGLCVQAGFLGFRSPRHAGRTGSRPHPLARPAAPASSPGRLPSARPRPPPARMRSTD